MRSILNWAATLVAGSQLWGCASSDRANPDTPDANDDRPIVLEVAGPMSLDVLSFNGDVVIEGNPELTQATITLKREAVHGLTRRRDARESLPDISMTAKVVPTDLGQMIQVGTRTINVEPHFQRAHLHIEAPVDGLRVRTAHGKVIVRNIRGPVDISTTDEDVRLMTNQAMLDRVTIVNRDGDIDYRVRGESTGKFDAQTINGQVTQIVKFGSARIDPTTSDTTLHSTVNEGMNPIVLRTVNGDIRIAFVHNPEQVGFKIID